MLIHALNARRSIKRISPVTILSDIGQLRDSPSYDIIHCHFGFHGNRAMLLREIGALNGKLVTTFHAADLTVMLNESGRDLYDHLFAKGDLFLPISHRWRERLIELGCEESKIQVHRMGIDCKRFTFRDTGAVARPNFQNCLCGPNGRKKRLGIRDQGGGPAEKRTFERRIHHRWRRAIE